MNGCAPAGGACTCGTSDISDATAAIAVKVFKHIIHERTHEKPSSHVGRFFLQPHNFLHFLIPLQLLPHGISGEWIKLFQARTGKLFADLFLFLQCLQYVVIHLAAAEYQALRGLRIRYRRD
jgi:hypothetical protein